MRIPLGLSDVGAAERKAVLEALDSSVLSLGPRLEAFEAAMAAYNDVPYAVAVNSGTSALHLATSGIRLGPGDEVITTAFSFVASANAILYTGARPVFVDIDPGSMNLDAAQVEAALTPRTRALLPVHVFGRPAPMRALLDIAERGGLDVIEDACEAIGAEAGGIKVGALGRAGVFGFFPNKAMTTAEGGVLLTGDADLARRAVRLRNQGRDPERGWFEHAELGYNYRLSEIHCALGLAQLQRLESMIVRREEVAAGYHARLAGSPDLILPAPAAPGDRLSWFVYVVRLSDAFDRADRDRIAERMKERGIGCGRYFAPIHQQPLYRERFGDSDGSLPQTERVAERTLALPFFNRITEAEQDEVSAVLRELVGAG